MITKRSSYTICVTQTTNGLIFSILFVGFSILLILSLSSSIIKMNINLPCILYAFNWLLGTFNIFILCAFFGWKLWDFIFVLNCKAVKWIFAVSFKIDFSWSQPTLKFHGNHSSIKVNSRSFLKSYWGELIFL